jgi:hypothetical protein
MRSPSRIVSLPSTAADGLKSFKRSLKTSFFLSLQLFWTTVKSGNFIKWYKLCHGTVDSRYGTVSVKPAALIRTDIEFRKNKTTVLFFRINSPLIVEGM